MSQAAVRIEKDSLGEVPVPADNSGEHRPNARLITSSIGQDLIPREMNRHRRWSSPHSRWSEQPAKERNRAESWRLSRKDQHLWGNCRKVS